MKAPDFFKDARCRLPLARDAEDFDDFLFRVLDEYATLVASMNAGDQVLKDIQNNLATIKDTIALLKQTVSDFLQGMPTPAANNLYTAVTNLKPFTAKLYTLDLSHFMGNLYRIRVSDTPLNERKHLFHIPFDLRHLVGPQRYSLQGIPCLYLGGSLFVCYEELDRPDFRRVWVSHFRLKDDESVKILDLGFRPSHIAALLDDPAMPKNPMKVQWINSLALAYGVCWPLLAACSVQVKRREGSFRPEYIVPQLVLQWVTESPDHDGLRYSSVNLGWDCTNSLVLSNFVFPAKTYAKGGVCSRLQTKFVLTEPVCWTLAEKVHIPGGNVNGNFEIEIIKGYKTMYLHTGFYEMECKLSQLPHASV
jgi:hypothetical protein